MCVCVCFKLRKCLVQCRIVHYSFSPKLKKDTWRNRIRWWKLKLNLKLLIKCKKSFKALSPIILFSFVSFWNFTPSQCFIRFKCKNRLNIWYSCLQQSVACSWPGIKLFLFSFFRKLFIISYNNEDLTFGIWNKINARKSVIFYLLQFELNGT